MQAVCNYLELLRPASSSNTWTTPGLDTSNFSACAHVESTQQISENSCGEKVPEACLIQGNTAVLGLADIEAELSSQLMSASRTRMAPVVGAMRSDAVGDETFHAVNRLNQLSQLVQQDPSSSAMNQHEHNKSQDHRRNVLPDIELQKTKSQCWPISFRPL